MSIRRQRSIEFGTIFEGPRLYCFLKINLKWQMDMKLKLSDPAKAQKYFEDKMEFTAGPGELQYFKKEKVDLNIIDVRAQEDYGQGPIPWGKKHTSRQAGHL